MEKASSDERRNCPTKAPGHLCVTEVKKCPRLRREESATTNCSRHAAGSPALARFVSMLAYSSADTPQFVYAKHLSPRPLERFSTSQKLPTTCTPTQVTTPQPRANSYRHIHLLHAL